MTRSLTDEEFESIGKPKEWGVLPVRPMGATIRMTKDRRILIRNTAEVYNPYQMSKFELKKPRKVGVFFYNNYKLHSLENHITIPKGWVI